MGEKNPRFADIATLKTRPPVVRDRIREIRGLGGEFIGEMTTIPLGFFDTHAADIRSRAMAIWVNCHDDQCRRSGKLYLTVEAQLRSAIICIVFILRQLENLDQHHSMMLRRGSVLIKN